MIRAKIRCHYVHEFRSSTGEKYAEEVEFSAVYSSDKNSENYSFAQATPSMTVRMMIDNPAAWGKFEAGKEYYNDFSPA